MTSHAASERQRGWAGRYAAFEDATSGIALVIAVTLILYGVVMRYVFESPLYWVDEISTYLAVWAALFGWSVAERDGHHIRVTLLVDRVPAPVRRWMLLASSALSAGFCLFLAYLGVVLELRYVNSGQVTLNTQAPLWLVYLAVPLAALMLGGRYVAEFLAYVRGGSIVAAGSD